MPVDLSYIQGYQEQFDTMAKNHCSWKYLNNAKISWKISFIPLDQIFFKYKKSGIISPKVEALHYSFSSLLSMTSATLANIQSFIIFISLSKHQFLQGSTYRLSMPVAILDELIILKWSSSCFQIPSQRPLPSLFYRHCCLNWLLQSKFWCS